MRRRIRKYKKFNTMSLTSNCKRYKGEIDNEKMSFQVDHVILSERLR